MGSIELNIDFASPTWRSIKEWTDVRIAEMRQKNDAGLGTDATANLRGQIAALKELQGLELQPIQPQKDPFAELARDRPMREPNG